MTYSRPSAVNPPRPLSKSSAEPPPGRAPGDRCLRAARWEQWGRQRRSVRQRPAQLRGQRTITPAEDETGGRLEQCRVVRGHAGRVAEEHAARPVDQFCRGPVLHQVLQPAAQFVARAIVVQKDQVRHQPAAAPVRVRLQDLPRHFQVAVRSDSHQRDWHVAGDGVRPESRLAETIPGDGLARPQGRARKEDGRRQPLEQRGVGRRQAQLGPPRRIARGALLEDAVHGLQAAEPGGQRQGLVPVFRRGGGERQDGGRSRLHPDPLAQAEDRVQHRSYGPRKCRATVHRRRVLRGAPPPQEASAVGLVLDVPRRLARQDLESPDRLLIVGARPAAAKQGGRRRMVFGLQEELGEGRVRLVRSARIEGHLGIARHLQRAGPVAAVGQGDAADFRVGVGNDRDLVTGLHVAVATADDRPVGAQIRLVLVGVSPEGLAAGGPGAAVVQVADVAVLAPAVARTVFPPAGHVHPVPGAVAAP